MFKVTAAAAEQIRRSADQAEAGKSALRIAAKQVPGGGIEYGMGWDVERANDMHLLSEGIALLISHHSKELLQGTVLDYVELNPGQFEFIFINPNDSGGESGDAGGGPA